MAILRRSKQAARTDSAGPRAARASLRSARRTLAGAALVALGGLASAQMAPGDMLVNVNDFTARLYCLRPDGTLRWVAQGPYAGDWQGCAVTPSGHVAVTRTTPNRGVIVFDAHGVQVHEFATPQIQSAADMSVFSDGTLVICDFGKLELYTESGAHVGTLFPTSANRPFGCHVDRNDHLFVCDQGGGAIPHRIFELDRAGQTLATHYPSFLPGDLETAADGKLWVTQVNTPMLHQLDAAGNPLAAYSMPFGGTFYGIATASDGALRLTPGGRMYRFVPWGLTYFDIPGLNNYSKIRFIEVVPCGGEPVVHCAAKVNSLGCTPAIEASGIASATASSGFTVRASHVRNQKAGLLLHGISGRNAAPFQGGTLCVAPPVRRSSAASSGGSPLPASDCSGVYALDMNAFAHGLLGGAPLPALRAPGTTVNCQWWGRDPGFPPPNATTLSDALEYVVCE